MLSCFHIPFDTWGYPRFDIILRGNKFGFDWAVKLKLDKVFVCKKELLDQYQLH